MQVPGFRQAKFLLFPLLRLVLIAPRFLIALRVRLQRSPTSLWGGDASNTVSGTAAIAGREDGASGSSVVVSLPGAIHSADDGADGGFPGALWFGRLWLVQPILLVPVSRRHGWRTTLRFLLVFFERAVEDTLQFALDVVQAFLPAVLGALPEASGA